MLRWFTADLHVHTCLSPCGDLSMSPRKIIAEAVRRHIDILAITDHNSAENVPALLGASEGTTVVVLPGMEVCTAEEAHVLAVFGHPEPAMRLQALVYDHLYGSNDADAFGLQVVANRDDEVEGYQERLLIGATDLSIDVVVRTIHTLQGLAVAAHIDREGYSVIGQLGFIPADLRFDALEISPHTLDEVASAKFRGYSHMPFIRNSDAHDLHHLGRSVTRYLLEEPSLGEITKALCGHGGRAVMTSPG